MPWGNLSGEYLADEENRIDEREGGGRKALREEGKERRKKGDGKKEAKVRG